MTIQTTKSEIINVIQNIDNEQTLNDLRKYTHEITANFSKKERVLIEQIRAGISLEVIDRLHTLIQESREGKSTDTKEKEIEYLVDITEAATAKRLENMIKLSKLWNVSVDEIRKKLNLKTPEPRVLW